MRRHILIAAVMSFLPIVGVSVGADERQDAARLEQLLADVRKVVPRGWDVEFELVDPRMPARRGTHPAIVINSDTPLPVEYFGINPPGRSGDEADPPPEIRQKVVSVCFVALPYLSPQSYAKAHKHNGDLIQRRIDFGRTELKGIRRGFMGPAPIPPDFYEPQTETEARLVRQYAYLWVSTQPRALPTHHSDQLAFEMRYLPTDLIKIHDAGKSKEYEQILDAVQKIIVPYESEP